MVDFYSESTLFTTAWCGREDRRQHKHCFSHHQDRLCDKARRPHSAMVEAYSPVPQGSCEQGQFPAVTQGAWGSCWHPVSRVSSQEAESKGICEQKGDKAVALVLPPKWPSSPRCALLSKGFTGSPSSAPCWGTFSGVGICGAVHTPTTAGSWFSPFFGRV